MEGFSPLKDHLQEAVVCHLELNDLAAHRTLTEKYITG